MSNDNKSKNKIVKEVQYLVNRQKIFWLKICKIINQIQEIKDIMKNNLWIIIIALKIKAIRIRVWLEEITSNM
jgi:hypothetical protein